MMSWIIGGMMLVAVVSALLQGQMTALSAGALSGCREAVQLAITLSGSIALWSGLMRVAEKSGLTQALGRLLRPVTHGLLFRRLPRDSPALDAISMNLTANLIGLGNAATPLGLAAMGALEKESTLGETASDEMITFVALNTASLQLIPTTTAFLRLQAGSAHPMEILLPVWISSLASVTVAVLLAKLLCRLGRYRVLSPRRVARAGGERL